MQAHHLPALRSKRHLSRLPGRDDLGARDNGPQISQVFTSLQTIVQGGSTVVIPEIVSTVPANANGAPSSTPRSGVSSSFAPSSPASPSLSAPSAPPTFSGPSSSFAVSGGSSSASSFSSFSSSFSASAPSSFPSISSASASSFSSFSFSFSSSSSLSSSSSFSSSPTSIPSSSSSSSSSASSSASSVAPLIALTVAPSPASTGFSTLDTPSVVSLSILQPSPTDSGLDNQASSSPASSSLSGGAAAPTSGLSHGAIGGIVAACFAVALLAGIVISRKCRRSRRAARRSTWLDTKYPFAGGSEKPSAADIPRASGIPAPSSGDDSWATFETFAPGGAQQPRQKQGQGQAQWQPGPPPAEPQWQPVVPVLSVPSPPPMAYNSPAAPAQPSAPAAAPAAFAMVRSTFVPTLPDELSIGTGERVRVCAEYDDGWALCRNMRGEQGVVPLECLQRERAQGGLQVQTAYPGQGTGDWRLSHRQSSMYAAESPASQY
ncbi:hypothetical protein B0H21DRAFT_560296 [Amylocystis lapponica]|nr:hypothetical protein B0H21DRAFT_560296 [Amylocystis lapponica]